MRGKSPPRAQWPRSPRLPQVRTVRDLGRSCGARRVFVQGVVVTFDMPTSGGSPTIAPLQWTGMRLRAGLFSVHDTSGAGRRAFTGFRGRVRLAGKSGSNWNGIKLRSNAHGVLYA